MNSLRQSKVFPGGNERKTEERAGPKVPLLLFVRFGSTRLPTSTSRRVVMKSWKTSETLFNDCVLVFSLSAAAAAALQTAVG